MGQIVGDKYILTETGDEAQAALVNAAAYPTPATGMTGQTPRKTAAGIGWDTLDAADVGAAAPGNELTVTLLAASWSSKTQTVSNAALVVSGYSYIVAPASASYAAYTEAQIYADDVTVSGNMTFHCIGDAPSSDLTVNILKVEVSA